MRKMALILTLMLLWGVGCAGSDDSSDAAGGEAGVAYEGESSTTQSGAELAGNAASAEDSGASGSGGSAASFGAVDRPSSLPDLGTSVIKTGDLTVVVDKDRVDAAVQAATAVARDRGGYVLSTALDDSSDPSASVSIRVPSEEFEASLGDLKAIGDVKSEMVEGRDVSEEFVDLEARLRNLEGQEGVLLRLYDRATSVVDTIRIQREVEDVQFEIERHRGRLRFLADRTALSTITVQFVGPDAVAVVQAEPTNAIGKAWAQAKDVALAMVSALIVSSGVVLPVGLLALVLWAGYRALRPRFSAGRT